MDDAVQGRPQEEIVRASILISNKGMQDGMNVVYIISNLGDCNKLILQFKGNVNELVFYM